MAENLHLVLNERGNCNLVHEGRVYNLKRTNMEYKQWFFRQVKKGCRGSIHTNLDVDAVLDSCKAVISIFAKQFCGSGNEKKVKLLLATAFLPPHDVPVAVELLGRDATGSIAALFNYFRVEWMPPDRLPMWNVYNVNIRTNNDLEGWHFKMNRLAGKRHLGFYELLQLLIDEQGSTETLIQQKYEELQQRITALTAEYNGGTRTLEQFLRAVAYHY
ncbi:hypothetical protein T01_1412 [Trichinella spiralis]|uniref:FLYWCH-type domain-containing protein n=1 Tax=Trichinella spiralis TaxID=6334 RepID=A0A0V1AWZ5_TRISP|nr:hypothetical protein T01_1412 [Trichinella spiralis]